MANVELFKHVGPRVQFGEVGISNDEAEAFRQTALKGAKINELILDDDYTSIQTSCNTSGFITDAAADYDVYSHSFYTKTTLGSDPDFWRSSITFARYNQKHSDTKIYNTYDVETQEGEVLMAVHRVRIIRKLSRLAFDQNGEPYNSIYSRQFKSYETQMVPEDIPDIDLRIERLLSRNKVTGGR